MTSSQNIESVIYETPNLGVKVIPFDGSKSLKNYMELNPEHENVIFSEVGIEEIASMYDAILEWLQPEKKSPEKAEERIGQLQEYANRNMLSVYRLRLISESLKKQS